MMKHVAPALGAGASVETPAGAEVPPAVPSGDGEGSGSARKRVRVGRMVELNIEDESRLPEICEQLLTNPLIEDYELEDA